MTCNHERKQTEKETEENERARQSERASERAREKERERQAIPLIFLIDFFYYIFSGLFYVLVCQGDKKMDVWLQHAGLKLVPACHVT